MATTYGRDFLEEAMTWEPPHPKNLFAAARYISDLFERNSRPNALLGGFAMRIRGSPRQTKDIDITVHAPMRVVWRVIEQEPRLIIPENRALEDWNRIFVWTGPSFGDQKCDEDVRVEVDIIPSGANGIDLEVGQHRELVLAAHEEPEVPAEPFHCLTLLHLVQVKMHVIRQANRPKDTQDLVWLFENFTDDIRGIAGSLNDNRSTATLETMLERGSITTAQANAYAELLGVIDD